MPLKEFLKVVGLMILIPILLIGLFVGALVIDTYGIIKRPIYIQPNSYTGRVVDHATGKPIEGAAVYMYWETELKLNLLQSLSSFEGAPLIEYLGDVIVYTDADGRYAFPKERIGGWRPWRWSKPYGEILIYKRGYVAYSNEGVFKSHYAERVKHVPEPFRKRDCDVRLNPWDKADVHWEHKNFMSSILKSLGNRANRIEFVALFAWEDEEK